MESTILMEADISFASNGPGVWKAGDRFLATEREARQMERNKPRLAHRVAEKVTHTVPVKDQIEEKPKSTKIDEAAESKPAAPAEKKAAAKRRPVTAKKVAAKRAAKKKR